MSLERGIAELAALLRRRELSPVEIVGESLARIDADRRLNAYATVLHDEAPAAARAAERELRDGRDRGPLHGLPIALKDNIDAAGVRTTGGSRAYRDRVPARDAAVWARLRRAGAILVGKTNLHELAYRAPHPDFGPVHNPHRYGYAPGGSSSGSGAAVAAGHVVAALGTDTGGSVRQPAAFCGVVGLKPSRAALPRAGVIPLARSLDVVGILARDLDDTRIVLDALAPARPWSGAMRIGLSRAPDDLPLSPAVADALEAAAATLARAGHAVSAHALPPLAPLRELHRRILHAEAFAAHRDRLEDTGPLFREAVLEGSRITADGYAAALRARKRLDVDALFGGHDVLLLPVTPDVAPPLDPATGRAATPVDINRWTFLANFADLPAVSVPVGMSDGLPVGVQLVGRRGAETLLLEIARPIFARAALACV